MQGKDLGAVESNTTTVDRNDQLIAAVVGNVSEIAAPAGSAAPARASAAAAPAASAAAAVPAAPAAIAPAV